MGNCVAYTRVRVQIDTTLCLSERRLSPVYAVCQFRYTLPHPTHTHLISPLTLITRAVCLWCARCKSDINRPVRGLNNGLSGGTRQGRRKVLASKSTGGEARRGGGGHDRLQNIWRDTTWTPEFGSGETDAFTLSQPNFVAGKPVLCVRGSVVSGV